LEDLNSNLFSSIFKGLEVFILNSSFSRISQAHYEPGTKQIWGGGQLSLALGGYMSA